jgi:beta-galactosidase
VGIERDSLLGVHRALFPRNVPIDYVHINHLSGDKLGQYKLVIFPYPAMLPEASARALRDYVSNGGALVAEARLAWNNERGYTSERIPGLGLWEVMGCRETAVETAPGGRTKIRWTGTDIPGIDTGSVLAARWYKETLEPLSSAARVVAQFEDGSPAAVMSTFGKGRTLMLGSYVSAAYQSAPTPEAARFFGGLLTWSGVTLPISVGGAPIEARHLENGSDALLFLFNHDRKPARSDVSLRRPSGDYVATDLVDGHPVALTSTTDGVRLSVELPAGAVHVVRISRR